MAGEKRGSDNATREDSEPVCKRFKKCDLRLVLHSEGVDTHYPESSKSNEGIGHNHVVEGEAFQITEQHLNAKSDSTQEKSVCIESSREPLDLNSDACADESLACNDIEKCTQNAVEQFSLVNYGSGCKNDGASGGIGLDLNTEDVSSSVDLNPFYPYRTYSQLKSKDASECGSSAGPPAEKDPLQIWKEMKQNGFLSPSYGSIPVPKQRGRKSKNDALKKKIEQAKQEQVDRFAKLAAPSGLLNGLNPGLINHVRNSKQVHSIIQAVVKSQERENRHVKNKQASQMRSGVREIGESNKELEKVNFSGEQMSSLSHEAPSFCATLGSKQMHEHHLSHRSSMHYSAEVRGVHGDLNYTDGRKTLSSSNTNIEEDGLAMKFSSSTNMISENTSSLTNEDSANINSVDSLSIRAATVASQWLQLLHQDVKGRLAALRRSRKRVRAVITTELSFLMAKEFSSNQENDPCVAKGSSSCYSAKATADLHQAHWSMLFNKMDNALAEEEKQLECWFNQVNQMQLHCEQGLQHLHGNTGSGLQFLGAMQNDPRSKMDELEQVLAVKAAAASIYSTCSFLLSKENVTCC
ncbi:hypothetical protein Ancab_034591 [Ancistrocladus abbreviatus]